MSVKSVSTVASQAMPTASCFLVGQLGCVTIVLLYLIEDACKWLPRSDRRLWSAIHIPKALWRHGFRVSVEMAVRCAIDIVELSSYVSRRRCHEVAVSSPAGGARGKIEKVKHF